MVDAVYVFNVCTYRVLSCECLGVETLLEGLVSQLLLLSFFELF